jgi:uncharacterized repeat protein (TIGR01451 family)
MKRVLLITAVILGVVMVVAAVGVGGEKPVLAASERGVDATNLVCPFYLNEYYGRTSSLYIQNAGAASATVNLQFSNGSSKGDTIPVNGSLVVAPAHVSGLPTNGNYSVKVSADQDIVAVVREYDQNTDMLASYNCIPESSASTKLFFGPYYESSAVMAMNTGTSDANVVVDFYTSSGSFMTTSNATVAAGERVTFYGATIPSLPAGVYLAVLTADQPMVGVLGQSNIDPEGDKTNIYQPGYTQGGLLAYLPWAYNSYEEGLSERSTRLFVANVGTVAKDVNLYFYKKDGTGGPVHKISSMAAGGSKWLDLGTSGIIPDGSAYSVVAQCDSPIILTQNTYYDLPPDEFGTATYESNGPGTSNYLPRLVGSMNNHTAFSVQNTGTSMATVEVSFYDHDGNNVDNVGVTIKPYASVRFDQSSSRSLPADFEGSAVIQADQQILTLIDEYFVLAKPDQMIFPVALHDYYGWDSVIYLQNPYWSSLDVELEFYWTTPLIIQRTIPAHGSAVVEMSDFGGLPINTIGTVVVRADDPLYAVMNSTGNYDDMVQSNQGIPVTSATTRLVAGPIFDSAALRIMNMGTASANVTVDFYSTSGSKVYTSSDTVIPHDILYDYLPGLPGFPSGFVGMAVVTADQPVIGLLSVSEDLPHRDTAALPMLSVGATTAYVPRVFNSVNEGVGVRSTQLFVANLGTSSADVTIKFYDQIGTVDYTHTVSSLAANGSTLIDLDSAGIIPEGNTYAVAAESTSQITLGEFTHSDTPSGNYGAAMYGDMTTSYGRYLPRLVKKADNNTDFSIQNTGSASVPLVINYYDLSGTLVDTENVNIPAMGWQRFSQKVTRALGVGFEGSAEIVSDQPLMVWVDEYSGTLQAEGPDLSASSKSVNLASVEVGDILTYIMVVRNSSAVTATASLTDPIPNNTSYVTGSASASDGSTVNLVDDTLFWSGEVAEGTPVVVEFAAEVLNLSIGTVITNTAELGNGAGTVIELSAQSVHNPGYGVTINEGAGYTDVPTVTLRFSWDVADNITSVKISNDGGFSSGSGTTGWLPVNAADPTYANWVLYTYGDLRMPRTVFVKFRDGVGTQYGPFQDDIIYDATPPVIEDIELITETLSFLRNSPQGRNVIVRVTTSDDNCGVASIQISHYEDFSQFETFKVGAGVTDIPWTLQASGLVYAQAKDRAGNQSVVAAAQGEALYELFLPLVVR